MTLTGPWVYPQNMDNKDALFVIAGIGWYDEDDDSLTSVPPNVTLGEN